MLGLCVEGKGQNLVDMNHESLYHEDLEPGLEFVAFLGLRGMGTNFFGNMIVSFF